MADSTLFSATFKITGTNKGRYDRVCRLAGKSTDNATSMTLDINDELYQVQQDERVDLVLASTLNLDGSKDNEKGFRDVSRSGPGAGIGIEQTLADSYDYVMHGKVYRFEDTDGENIKMYASFGGLLLYMEGPYKQLTPLRIDYIYLLMKK